MSDKKSWKWRIFLSKSAPRPLDSIKTSPVGERLPAGDRKGVPFRTSFLELKKTS